MLACFTALVWLDSAAFFIIQNTPDIEGRHMARITHLGPMACCIFGGAGKRMAACAAGVLSLFSPLAFLALGIACLLLLDPDRVLLASIFYPIGVSLYSVALVAYPSLLAPATSAAERGRQAGWLYAIAGWSGSAMGIGMGQNLGYVPPVFVLAAGAVVLLPWLLRFFLQRERETGTDRGRCCWRPSVLIAFCLPSDASPPLSQSSAAGRSTSPKAASTAIPNMCAQIRRMF